MVTSAINFAINRKLFEIKVLDPNEMYISP